MTERVKLTKPQREELERLSARDGRLNYHNKPGLALVEMGLAERGAPLGMWDRTLRITPAGCAYLAEERA